MIENFQVHEGDECLPAFQRIVKAIEGLQIRPGFGLLAAFAPFGTVLSLDSSAVGASFAHPWRPTLTGSAVTFVKGLVNGMEPTVNGVKMSGDASKTPPVPAPTLQLDPAFIDPATQESVIALSATPSADGKTALFALVQAAKVPAPGVADPKTGAFYQPLAIALWQKNKPVSGVSIAMHNLNYAQGYFWAV